MHPQPELGSMVAGRYRLVRELGRGGMGVVLEAENAFTGRQVAIKWLHPNLAGNHEAAMRLMREATATSRIRHPNVVDVYDVINEDGAIYLVMELLEGEPLEALLERGGVPFHELIALLLPAMRGVAEAHRLGIIHRDVHPANIFLAKTPHDERLIPKVLDFGISKVENGPSLTRSGTTLGTPLYMSYEQLCSASDVDRRADIYAFGVILYEALTGQPPFRGETFPELAVKIATATPVPPKQLVPALPAALERIILRAMAREREERTPDLQTLIRELEPFASQVAFGAHEAHASAERGPEASPRTPTPLTPRPTEAVTTPHVVASERRAVAAPSLPPPKKSFVLYAVGALALIGLGVLGWLRPGFEQEPKGVGAAPTPPPVIEAAPAPTVVDRGTPDHAPDAPPPKLSDTKAPDTKAPDTKAPDTKAPDTKAPDVKAPDTKAAASDPRAKKVEDKAKIAPPLPSPRKCFRAGCMDGIRE